VKVVLLIAGVWWWSESGWKVIGEELPVASHRGYGKLPRRCKVLYSLTGRMSKAWNNGEALGAAKHVRS
jgi:hypothetical protein